MEDPARKEAQGSGYKQCVEVKVRCRRQDGFVCLATRFRAKERVCDDSIRPVGLEIHLLYLKGFMKSP